MHQMIKSNGIRQTVVQELPTAAIALVIAELFYKFHSFVLECLAFLATWYVLSLILNILSKAFSKAQRSPPQL